MRPILSYLFSYVYLLRFALRSTPIFCVSTKNQSPAPLLLLFPKKSFDFLGSLHETDTSASFLVYLSTSDCSSPHPDFLCFHKNHSYVLSPHKHLSFMGQYYSLSGIFPFSFHPLDKFYFTTKMLYAGSITMTTPI